MAGNSQMAEARRYPSQRCGNLNVLVLLSGNQVIRPRFLNWCPHPTALESHEQRNSVIKNDDNHSGKLRATFDDEGYYCSSQNCSIKDSDDLTPVMLTLK